MDKEFEQQVNEFFDAGGRLLNLRDPRNFKKVLDSSPELEKSFRSMFKEVLEAHNIGEDDPLPYIQFVFEDELEDGKSP